MDELIRDPLWTFVGVVLALLAVIVTVAIFFAQRKKKRLSYEVVSNTQLLGVKEEIQGKVKVLYEGNEVKNVHLLTIKFANTGNVPISSSDYERPIVMSVNQEATILTHEVINEEPANLGAQVEVDGSTFQFKPILLNSKDSFSLKTLISDLEGKPSIDGRINGVKSIEKYSEGQASLLITGLASLVLIAAGAIFASTGNDTQVFGKEISRDTIGGGVFAIGYVLMLVSMVKNKRMLGMIRVILRKGVS